MKPIKMRRMIRTGYWLGLGCCILLPLMATAVSMETGPIDAAASSAAAQHSPVTLNAPLRMEVKCLTPKPRLGDDVELQVRITAQASVTVLPGEYGKALGDWEVRGVRPGKTQFIDGLVVREDSVKVVSYLAGKIEVPSLVQKFKDTDGKPAEFRSAPVLIQVEPLPQRKGDQPGHIRGLKSPVGMLSWWLVAILTGVLLMLGAAWVWYDARRKKETQTQEPAKPKRPAEAVARERLQALRASDLILKGNFKQYYIELSDILRRFLEDNYMIPVIDRTTIELLRELKKTACERQDTIAIRNVLEQSDMVKFAKMVPDEKQAHQDWDWVQGVVAHCAASRMQVQTSTEENQGK